MRLLQNTRRSMPFKYTIYFIIIINKINLLCASSPPLAAFFCASIAYIASSLPFSTSFLFTVLRFAALIAALRFAALIASFLCTSSRFAALRFALLRFAALRFAALIAAFLCTFIVFFICII